MMLKMKVKYLDGEIWKEKELKLPFTPNKVIDLPNEYPFNQELLLGPDAGYSFRTIYITPQGKIEYLGHYLDPRKEEVFSPLKSERITFVFSLDFEGNGSPYITKETPEETYDEDIDDDMTLFPYFIIVKGHIVYPNYHNDYADFTVALLVKDLDNGEPNFVPYFYTSIEYLGVDRIKDVVSLNLKLGKDIKVDLKLNKPEKIEFSYLNEPKDQSSLREGYLELELRAYDFIADEIKGAIFINEELHDLSSNELKIKMSGGLDGISLDSDESIYGRVSEEYYTPYLIDEEHNFVLLMGIKEEEGEDLVTYYPLYKGEQNLYHDRYTLENETNSGKDITLKEIRILEFKEEL